MGKTEKFKTEIINTIIGEDSHFSGVVNTQRSIRIEGSFEGEIHSQGEVHIGAQSRIQANIYGKKVIIAGEVKGNIETATGLEISKTGKVYGDVKGDRLIISEGAIYKGKVNMDIISAKNPYEGDVQLTNATSTPA